MGILTCFYRPTSTSIYNVTEIVNIIHPGWIYSLDSIRIQSGNQLSETIPLRMALSRTSSGHVFQIFNSSEELDLGGIYLYHEVVRVNQKKDSSYVFIFNINDNLNKVTRSFLSDSFLLNHVGCSYGFSREWDKNCVKAYEYSTGVRVALSFADLIDTEPSESANWGKLYLYGSNKEWKTKLRDVYPVNFLSKELQLGHGKIVDIIKADPDIFGVIKNIDEQHVVWIPHIDNIDNIRFLLRDFLIPGMR